MIRRGSYHEKRKKDKGTPEVSHIQVMLADKASSKISVVAIFYSGKKGEGGGAGTVTGTWALWIKSTKERSRGGKGKGGVSNVAGR